MRFLSPDDVIALVAQAQTEPGVVHVWPCELSGTQLAHEQCARVLSEPELARAARFFHERDRTGFVFSHGLLRHVLGACCGVPGASLEFATNEFGKPSLVLPAGANPVPISFNLSHSHGRALLAVSDGRHLGVDIEKEDARKEVLSLAERYFFGPEFEAVRNAPAPQAAQVFFRFWAAKEAVIKAQGRGLSVPLDAFHVVFDEDFQSARVETSDEKHLDSGWFVRALPCDEGWHAATAARGTDWRVRVMTRR